MAISLGKESVFEGLSYDDFAKPWQQYATQYEKMQDQLDKLEQAALIQNQIKESDGNAYTQYMNYLTALNKQAEDFAGGMTLENVKGITGLRREYMNNIMPIVAAVERRNALAEEQRQQLYKDPSTLFEQVATDITLDDLMQNPNNTYGKQISLNDFQTELAAVYENFRKALNEINSMPTNTIPSYMTLLATKFGISEKDLKNFINNTDSNSVYRKLYENALNKYNLKQWNTYTNIEDRLKNAANLAITSAIGQTDLSPITDTVKQAWAMQPEELDTYKKKNEIDKDYEPPLITSFGSDSGSGSKGKDYIISKQAIQIDEDGNENVWSDDSWKDSDAYNYKKGAVKTEFNQSTNTFKATINDVSFTVKRKSDGSLDLSNINISTIKDFVKAQGGVESVENTDVEHVKHLFKLMNRLQEENSLNYYQIYYRADDRGTGTDCGWIMAVPKDMIKVTDTQDIQNATFGTNNSGMTSADIISEGDDK